MDNVVAAIKQAARLEEMLRDYLVLIPRQQKFWATCPFHKNGQERTPSLQIDPQKQLWHCFGCHAGGDLFSFIQQMTGQSFADVRDDLAERFHLAPQKFHNPLYDVYRTAQQGYSHIPDAVRGYL
jgi:DNA primase